LKRSIEVEREILYTFKIVIVGGPSVGKTCLFNRFCFNSFNFDTSMTIGLNFHSINLKIVNKYKKDFSEELYIVNSIFDFGGQERFKPLIPKFVPVYCQPFVDFSVRMCHRHWRLSYFSHARSLDAIGYVL